MRFKVGLCSIVVVGVSLWGCGSASHPAVRPALSGVPPQIEGALSPQEESWLEENCPAGTPILDPSWPYGPTALVAREGYALQHACVDRLPLWVCEHVTADELSGSAKRRNRFAADLELDIDCRSELEDYRGSGFDRGHMAPAGNQVQSQDLKDETFFLSNMSPQVGSGFNRSVWAKLEGAVRDWVDGEDLDDLYVITGGFFYDPEEEDASVIV